jgi:hypothetical protein
MTAPRGEGRGSKPSGDEADKVHEERQTEQIEYLLYQSTQGLHFIFDHGEVAKVLSQPDDGESTLTIKDMEKVHSLLSSFLERPSLNEKRSYLDSLPRTDYELLVRAYFQLVDKTILANSDLRH